LLKWHKNKLEHVEAGDNCTEPINPPALDTLARKGGKVNENGFLVCHPRAVGIWVLIFKGYAEVQKNLGIVKRVIKEVNVCIFLVYQPDL